MTAAPLVQMEGVRVERDGAAVLQDITVEWRERRLGVIGANGSGKSTFARLLNGLVRPTAGSVRVNGLRVDRQARAVRRQVGFVFQQPDHQIVMPLVHEDVAFGLTNQGWPRDRIDARVAQVLQEFGLTPLALRPCHSLSGGEKQLLALAGAVAGQPAMIVLDEPTTMLDLRNGYRIARVMRALPQPLVLVTHHLELLEDFDRVLVLHHGRLVLDAAPAEAIAAYRAWAAGAGDSWAPPAPPR